MSRVGSGRSRVGLSATSESKGLDVLTSEERAVVLGARPHRQVEFATGRWCAREALRQSGHLAGDVSLLPDADGVPMWPARWVGSITHADGWVGAVAVRRGRAGVVSIGLDAERPGAVGPDALEVVASEREREVVEGLTTARPDVDWPTVLHVAKEAAYKAWFPVGRAVLHHGDVRVELEDASRFRAWVGPSGGPAQVVEGRWTSGPAAVVAMATLRRGDLRDRWRLREVG